MLSSDSLTENDSYSDWIEAFTERLHKSIPSRWPKKGFPHVQDQASMREFIGRVRSHMYAYEKEKAENVLPSTPEIDRLLTEIDEAFAEAGDEGAPYLALAGEALDGSYFPEMLDILSGHEVRGNWRAIPHCLLYACDCCLSFVEPLAYRFLLPAYMRFSLLNDYSPDMTAHLAADRELLDYRLNKFSHFDARQCEVVTRYMNWHRQHDGASFDLGWLLPWEMKAYLTQDEHSSPQDWVLAQYGELMLCESR